MTLDDALAHIVALERANYELTLERDGARLNNDKLLAEAADRVGTAESRVQELEREVARLQGELDACHDVALDAYPAERVEQIRRLFNRKRST